MGGKRGRTAASDAKHRSKNKKKSRKHSEKEEVVLLSSKISSNHNQKGVAKKAKGGKDEVLVLSKRSSQESHVEESQEIPTTNLRDPKPRPFEIVSKTKQQQFLTEDQDAKVFRQCLQTTYCGFECEAIKDQQLHNEMREGLNRLLQSGYFHYDCVQYGDKVNITRVQRVLVGEEGITYLYQKLRLFALPWTDESICNGALGAIRKLNKYLQDTSKKQLLQKYKQGGHVAASSGVGRCDFNLTLINAALTNTEDRENDDDAPPVQPLLPFKADKKFQQKKELAVNWHKDSTLEPFSTIAVYQHTPDPQSDDWEIAMSCERENTAPPLRKKLRDGDCYFMLGNFNHHFLHAVVAGQSARYASTHRVAVVQDATYESIRSKCKEVLSGNRFTGKNKRPEDLDATRVRLAGELDNTLEFQWLRMFYCQGKVHEQQHQGWWTPRIQALENIWRELEKELSNMAHVLITFPAKQSSKATPKTFKMLLYILQTKQAQRQEWAKRLRDSTYRKLPPAYRPIDRPSCTQPKSLPYDLEDLIDKLQTAFRRAHGK